MPYLLMPYLKASYKTAVWKRATFVRIIFFNTVKDRVQFFKIHVTILKFSLLVQEMPCDVLEIFPYLDGSFFSIKQMTSTLRSELARS